MEHDLNILMNFGIKYIYPYNVLLAIAMNIHVLLMTAFVLQGHIFVVFKTYDSLGCGQY